ncbi:MAG TPA: GNAT family N-acetyltransferase [Acidimicrobiales bacterium]|nr:GNAT family N-acetyltransferase [Acidimicrobiales bacterium]
MEVRLIDPTDEDALAEWAAVLVASDKDMWPDLSGFTLSDIRAFARFRGASRRWELLAAGEPGGPILGVALMEFPLIENLHSAEIALAVHPAHRRHGIGTALVEQMEVRAAANGRRTLNTIVDVPVALAASHPSRAFAPRVGFASTLAGNMRHLRLPLGPERLSELRAAVANAPDASDYRTLTFETPWPAEFLDDECTLIRVMSTDEPAGDGERQAEHWDEARLRENDELLTERNVRKLAAVAQHLTSGQVVAMSELLIADESPGQSWQLLTVVHPDHRGHRLGLAIKLANLGFLAERGPGVGVIVTGNAAVNEPMIAVNDMLGYEIASEGAFWQKHLTHP